MLLLLPEDDVEAAGVPPSPPATVPLAEERVEDAAVPDEVDPAVAPWLEVPVEPVAI
jgi:hypothetical protein